MIIRFRMILLAFSLMISMVVQGACGGNRAAQPTVSAPVPATATVSIVVAPTVVAPTPTATVVTTEQPHSPLSEASTSPLSQPEQTVALFTARVVDVLPHDRDAFTQGLVYMDKAFYEGTGLRGRSSLRRVNPPDGKILQEVELDPALFGEGITIFEERIYQLTWQAQQGFVYDKKNFEPLGSFAYLGEGWGLTHNGQHLIMSDGTDALTFRDPDTFEEIRRVNVHDRNGPITRLNELEYIDGHVYANIWQTNLIAVIDPTAGRVLAWINLSNLLEPQDYADQPVDVLNGIAYDEVGDRLFVTGKLWPKIFQIELEPFQ